MSYRNYKTIKVEEGNTCDLHKSGVGLFDTYELTFSADHAFGIILELLEKVRSSKPEDKIYLVVYEYVTEEVRSEDLVVEGD